MASNVLDLGDLGGMKDFPRLNLGPNIGPFPIKK